MESYKKKFVNELGNTISVQVDSKEIDGIEGVSISITGPTSLNENHVTLLEAQVIFEQLGLLLDKRKG